METQAQTQTQEMSQPQVRVIKSVDAMPQQRGIVPAVDNRALLESMRNGLLMQVAAIEKALGIDRRCSSCGKRGSDLFDR